MLKRLIKFTPKPTWSNNVFSSGSGSGSGGGLGEGPGPGVGLGGQGLGEGGEGVTGAMPKHWYFLHGLTSENSKRTVKINKKLFCCKYCRKLGNAKI